MKPQDIVVALKILAMRGDHWSQNGLAHELGVSPSEVNGALKRLVTSRLFHYQQRVYMPRVTAISEFVLHGLKYVFPGELGEPSRGIPTAHAAPVFEAEISHNEVLPVWPHPEGHSRGYALAPLHKCVPGAALRDTKLYSLLAIVDALRLGRAREAAIAKKRWLLEIESH